MNLNFKKMVKLNEHFSVAHPNSVNVIYRDNTGKEIKTMRELQEYIKVDGNIMTTIFGAEVLRGDWERVKRFFKLLSEFRLPRVN
jgi:hypothetical protein